MIALDTTMKYVINLEEQKKPLRHTLGVKKPTDSDGVVRTPSPFIPPKILGEKNHKNA